ncbi:hypothetical protein AKJ09_09311 [Labilithrix luteola]|uniref:Uncharacterized protein n=1 Tax=Labilithrix luteola TaxID=1391654 RepID=A0A0K1QA89_9BACT|nr:hypothetical protein [Labilithrix luteola]AKV02648.1 hypothetical protein AKJ09_09311 [Labilithrix luteola]
MWFDQQRKTTHVCVTLGVTTKTLRLAFAERPDVRVFESEEGAAHVLYSDTTQRILSLLTIECNVRHIPTREQLRKICDAHREPEAIKRALEAQ